MASTAGEKKPILIIGAGLSGLAAARILTQHHFPVIVFEQSSRDRSQGHGITIRDWAFKPLLAELGGGLSVKDLQRAVATDRGVQGSGWVDLSFRNNESGETLFNPESADAGETATLFRANRSVLREWLGEGVDVRYEHKLVRLEGKPGQVTAFFENGAAYEGLLLVAADGVHSTTRKLLFPQSQQPNVLPVVLFHGKAYCKREEYDTVLKQAMNGSNVAAGVGDSFNTFITIADAEEGGVWLDWSYSRARVDDADPLWMPDRSEVIKVPQHLLKEIRSRDLVPPFSTIIDPDEIKKGKIYNWRIMSVHMARDDLNAAAADLGVVFVGDSVHAMPIFGGEGGNHALLDGLNIAKLVCARMNPSGGNRQGGDEVKALVQEFYDGNLQRSEEAVRRCVQRFSSFHKPVKEWLHVAEMAKKRSSVSYQVRPITASK